MNYQYKVDSLKIVSSQERIKDYQFKIITEYYVILKIKEIY